MSLPALSTFGNKLSARTGISELMDDLGSAMREISQCSESSPLMLGGGNPAAIEAMQAVWRRQIAGLCQSGCSIDAVLGNYDPPRGRTDFINALADYLNGRFGWQIDERNIAMTNGSQNLSFLIFNMLAGRFPDGSLRKVLLPITPEYVGYADQGLEPEMFRAVRPKIERLSDHAFKYRPDLENLVIGEDVALVALSRPTNPTGNVVTDEELLKLAQQAESANVPLFIDNAYGAPFPNIIFEEVRPYWSENVIMALSLSKLGLPGVRTGIVVANEQITRLVSAANAILSLANANLGPALVQGLLESGEIDSLTSSVVKPFYRDKANQAISFLHEFMDDKLPWRIHKCEGSLFLWLWCEGLPIGSRELYRRLKERQVIVVPGDYFFFGLDEPWAHSGECLRINFSQPEATVREGLRIIAEEVTRAYRG